MTTPKHTFRPFQGDSSVCVLCGKTEPEHNIETKCDVCDRTGGTVKYTPKGASAPINYCTECLDKEHKAEYARRYAEMSPDERVAEMDKNWKERATKHITEKLEQEVTIKTDVFNAEIPSIISLKATVDADDAIPPEKKNEAFALAVKAQFDHLTNILFELNQARDIVASRQKSIQQYLNEFVKKLTVEEREKIKVQDLNYQPKTTTPKTPKVSAPKTAKYDREAIAEVIKEFPFLTSFQIQATCLQMNKTPAELADFFRGQKKQ